MWSMRPQHTEISAIFPIGGEGEIYCDWSRGAGSERERGIMSQSAIVLTDGSVQVSVDSIIIFPE